MKVLWVCNQCLPVIAEKLHIPVSNKEGWIAGLFGELVCEKRDLELAVAFPYPENKDFPQTEFSAFGFMEDLKHPEVFDERVTDRMREIIKEFQPDIVHIFGTEYGHALAAARACANPKKVLVGFQGVCTALAEAYLTGVDPAWVNKSTLRDRLKNDNLKRQKEKYEDRAWNEAGTLALAGYVTGRTRLDRKYASDLNPKIRYFTMNETLRREFYTGRWTPEKAVPESIFVSQCDYPIKGFHILIRALGILKREYPQLSVRVAGNIITGDNGLKKKIQISTYGKYLNDLMKQTGTRENIRFLGQLSAEEMKREYLSCAVFVMPSVMENSPNSVGEAMLLGTPCIASNVGGIPDILENGRDGILYEATDANALADAIKRVFQRSFDASDEISAFCENAVEDARIKHDGKENVKTLLEIYHTMIREQDT